jgi:hypothetical protein
VSIYAELGVPEVWRYDGLRLTIYQLDRNRQYQPCESSLSLPGLTPAGVERFMELGKTTPKRQWAREIRAWARAELTPRQKTDRG